MLLEILNEKRIAATKAKNEEDKRIYSYYYAVVQKVFKDGGDEVAAVSTLTKEKKALEENLRLARNDEQKNTINYEILILSQFLPKQLTIIEIQEQILEVCAELGIEKITSKDKGKIMKPLMTRVKGKADGKIVNEVLAAMI